MEEYNTLEGVTALFNNAGCNGRDNTYFMGHVSSNFYLTQGLIIGAVVGGLAFGAIGGAIGGLIGGTISTLLSKSKNGVKSKCDAYLVNQTEKGIGLIPLHSKGKTSLTDSTKILAADPDGFTFIDQNNIKKVTIKKVNTIVKKVMIQLADGNKYSLYANAEEKNISYHASNFTKFTDKYKQA